MPRPWWRWLVLLQPLLLAQPVVALLLPLLQLVLQLPEGAQLVFAQGKKLLQPVAQGLRRPHPRLGVDQLPGQILALVVDVIEQGRVDPRHVVDAHGQHDPALGEVGVISSVTQAFCHDCNRARLSTEGQLYLCLFATEGHDLRHLIRGGASDAELASAIGASITSGGTGKKMDSMVLSTPRYHGACGCAASVRQRS